MYFSGFTYSCIAKLVSTTVTLQLMDCNSAPYLMEDHGPACGH